VSQSKHLPERCALIRSTCVYVSITRPLTFRTAQERDFPSFGRERRPWRWQPQSVEHDSDPDPRLHPRSQHHGRPQQFRRFSERPRNPAATRSTSAARVSGSGFRSRNVGAGPTAGSEQPVPECCSSRQRRKWGRIVVVGQSGNGRPGARGWLSVERHERHSNLGNGIAILPDQPRPNH